MTEAQEKTRDHLNSLDDSQLLAVLRDAEVDLRKAAQRAPESEWHQSCFAAVLIYAGEVGRRGLSIKAVH